MRQKYVISRNDDKNKLKIKEYAIIDKNLNKVASSMLQKGDQLFDFQTKLVDMLSFPF